MKSFIRKVKRKVFWLLLDSWFVQWFLQKILPKIRFSTTYGGLTPPQFNWFLQTLKHGDVIVSKDSKKLSSKLIPGNWAHAAIAYQAPGESIKIAEAIWPKIKSTDLFEFAKECEDLMILRPKLQSDDAFFQGLTLRLLTQYIGRPYDTHFSRGPRRLYCSELIWRLLPEFRFDWSDFADIGFEYLSPDGVAECPDFEQLKMPKIETYHG